MTPLTRFAAWLRLPARGRRERVAVVEECEQRILYSADLNPALWAGHGDAMTSSAIVRAVDEAPPQATQDSAASVQTQQEQRRHEIVFVDAAVPDAQNLIDGILAQRSDGADIEVVQLRTDADGLRQIADVLAGERGIDAVHIVSHGGPGLLRLGNGDVGLDTLQERDGELQRWSDALGADADILLYGCDVAAGDEGAAFIAQLAQAIGADVAASTDATGHESLGGDWQLESSTGTIDAELAVTAQLQQAWSNLLAIGVGATTTGTTTGSSLTVSHTTAAGADRLMLVGVSMREISSESVSSMTYNGRSLTFQGAVQAADGARVEIWSLLAPSVGTSNLVANLTGAGGGTNVAVMTFTGVDQTTPLGAFASALGDGNNGSATVSSATGELVFGAVAVKDVNQDLVPGPGQTERWDLFTGTEANGGGSTEAGAASVAMSWSWSAGTDWAIGGVSIKPATISVTPTAGLSTTEAGGTASFNVVLYSAPTNDVTIPVSSSDTSEGTVSTASLTFTAANWSTPQTVTVTGVDDTLADGFQPYTIVLNTASSTDAAYDNLNPADVQAANADNDINYGLITVNTTSDASDGDTSSLTALAANRGADDAISLREAIIAANNTANGVGGADRIHFNIAGAGPHTISLASALPTITGAVVVDASTEPDYTANTPVVRIDGASAGANVDGLTLSSTSDGSTIRGLMITRFTRDGIAIQSGADNITIAGNWIGTTGTSSTGVGNTDDGIDIAGSAAIIGGTGANDRNVITNSGDEGITIVGSGVTGHLIAGNYIGVDPDGASGGGNTDVGIAIISGSGNTIGGTSAAARNVISKNWEGIEVNTSNNTIQGNYIGTDATGALNRGNRLGDGIQIQGSAANIAVGGTTASAANLIAYNAGNGVGILAGTGHQVLGNAIHSNSGLGIDLGAAGLAANDANDVDGGANNLQNFPLLGSVAVNGSQVVIAGTLNSEASKTYRIEFFANTANDNEGQRYLGFTDVTTPAGAPYTVSFTATLTASVAAGEYITATATDPSNNTSEFSAQVIAASGMAIWTNNTGSPQHATWDGSGFGTASAPNSLGEWTHVQAVESPTRSEIIAVGVDASGVIRGELWNGSSWTAFSFNDIVDLATTGYQSFQIAYEQQSGDALLVWENGTTGSTSLSYRTWNGTAWSAAQTITTPVSGEAVQLRLAADPNSDSMVLAVTGTPLSNDYALVWNGSGWGNPVTLDTSTGIDGTEVHVAYEAHSGQALVVYDGDGTTNALNYRTWDGTSWSAQQSLTAPAGVAAASDVSFSVLASDPNSNRIALGVVSEPEIWLAVWDGDAWTSTLTATASAGSTTSLNVALAFEHDSGDLLAAYGKSGSNFVAFRSWTSAGGWSAETAADTNLNLGATPQALSLVADPNSNQLMLATRDSGNDVRYALWTGSAWSVALADSTTDAGGVYAMPMAFVWYYNNRTPVIGSTGWSVAETSTTAGTVASGDADGHTRTYAIVGGVDAAKFAIGSASGVLSFVSAPDFEAPTDVGGNNVYDVKVQVSDGQGGTDSQDISVTVTDVSGTLVVSTTADNTDSGIVGGNAAHTVEWLNANKGADGFVSLREAVIAANNSAGNDTINLAAGTYTLAIGGSGEDGSATGDLDVQTNITIAGAGIASTIISGGGIDRPIEVDGSGNLTLSDVTLTGGSVNNDGGGLLVEEAGGSATLTRVDITGNTITGGARIGGGIHNVGSLVMTDSLVHGNTATGSDGGGVSNLGTATLTRTSIYSNSARYGGGIHQLAGAMTVENATVSGNTASAEGGGIDVAAGTLTVRYSTVAANTASGGNGGGVMVRAGTLTALSSIFADNSSSTGGRDLHGTFTSQGFNIIEHNAGFTGAVGTDQLGTDPSLAALALDVASGQVVHALNAGSIAINMGGGAPPATDQRGVTRDASADVGAYERVNTAPVLDNTGTMSLTTITEDQTNNAGDLVSSIISSAGGDRITDANGDPEGIAITSLVSGNGSWEYSITGGASWAAIGTVTNASALLLRSTDRVRFVPNAASGTSASITFRAWDRNIGTAGTKVSTASNGGSTPFSLATEDAAIAVTEVNDAPVLAAIGNRSVNEGATLSFTASATDADLPGQTLSYSLDAASLALGMTINASTGAFTWTPSEAQGGLAPSVTVTVTDNGSGTLTDSETFTITVGDTNVAPVLAAIGNRSVNEGATLSFTASATDADLPSQTLSYSLDAASLALGMSINASSGAFSWTPSEAQGGTAPSVTITVTDNGTGNLFDSETFTITVGDTNVAPVLAAIGNRSVNEGATLAFTASATDADLPAQSLTYSLDAASLALGMSINASSGAFSWTPSEAQGGLAPAVTITVTDNGSGNLTDSETFTITVGDTNLAPVLAAIGNRSVNEGATLSFTASATDADLPSQTLSYSLDAASLVLGMTINASTGAFTWTPSEAQGGLTPSVTVTVTDNGSGTLTDSETFTITVGDTNVAPVLAAIGNRSVNEGATLNFIASATDADLPSQTLSYSLDAASLALGMSINASSGAFSWTPSEAQGGLTPSVTITVTDNGSGNLTDSETFTITVGDTNVAPVLAAIGNRSVNEGATLSFTASATDADLPSQTLSYSLDAASLALGMSINASSGAFSWTPSEAQGGLTPSVTITVTDNGTGNLFDSETFTITVGDTNVAPVLAAIGNRSVNEGATLSFTASATDADLPSQTLSYSLDAASLALGMSINASSGAFSWTPSEAQGGTAPSVTITVTDNGTGNLFDSETFTITVGDTNVAPVLAAIGNRSVNEGATLAFTASATDADLPAQSLTYSLDAASLALGMSINASSGAFSWTPSEAQGGTAPSVTITVTDNGSGNLTDSETFTITVGDTNVAPVLAAIGNRSVNEGATLSFTASATDADLPSQTLSYSLDAASLALGMTINVSSGAFSWTPSEAQGGLTPSVTVTVTDNGSGNLTDSETFTITVGDTNVAPVLAAIGNRSVNEGATLNFIASATDADLPAQSLTYSLDAASLALGMSINASSGAFSWTPTEAQGGLTPSVTITVTDNGSGNLTDSETFTITVIEVNGAPSGAAVVTGATTEDQTLTADTSSIADADGLGAFSYQWQRNGSDIVGAIGSTFTLGDADVGANIRVLVSYSDGNGTAESLTSAAVGPVANVDDAPIVTSNGGGAAASIGGAENLSTVSTVTSTDIDGAAPSYSIAGGADAARFTIDATTGVLSFIAAPDFEAPTDADADNVYHVTVQVSDGSATDSQAIGIAIGNVNEAPSGIAPAGAAIDEQAPAGTLVASVSASDPDAGELFSFTLVSDAAGRFAVDASSGRVTVAPGAVLDFQTQPSFDLLVRVTDAGGLSIVRTLTVALRQLPAGSATPPTTAPPVVPTESPTFSTNRITRSTPEHGQDAAAPKPVPRSAGTSRPVSLDGELVRVSPATESDAAPAGGQARHDAQRPWLHLREREGVDGLALTVSLDGVPGAGGPSPLTNAALRLLTQTLRNAAIEAEPADGGETGGHRTPSTLIQFLQDPVRVAGVGFTAGFVWWLTRSGGLLTSMLMGVPAWRHLDLLPVVARRRNDDEDGDDDGPESEQAPTASGDLDDSALLDLFEAKPAPHPPRSPR